jgi:hypothetical protein
VVTFLGATVRLDVRVRGRLVSVDVAAEAARGLERKQAVVVAFLPADAVVLPAGDDQGGKGEDP